MTGDAIMMTPYGVSPLSLSIYLRSRSSGIRPHEDDNDGHRLEDFMTIRAARHASSMAPFYLEHAGDGRSAGMRRHAKNAEAERDAAVARFGFVPKNIIGTHGITRRGAISRRLITPRGALS